MFYKQGNFSFRKEPLMSAKYIQRVVKFEPCDYRLVLRLAKREGLGRSGFSVALHTIIEEWEAEQTASQPTPASVEKQDVAHSARLPETSLTSAPSSLPGRSVGEDEQEAPTMSNEAHLSSGRLAGFATSNPLTLPGPGEPGFVHPPFP
jgi:hypothetical protein